VTCPVACEITIRQAHLRECAAESAEGSANFLQRLFWTVSEWAIRELISSVNSSAFIDTDPTDETITSGFRFRASGHFVERSQVLPSDSEGAERREVCRLACRFHIELRADAPDKFAERRISPVVNVASVRNKTACMTSLISPSLPTGFDSFLDS
jgi:hypothetical protein